MKKITLLLVLLFCLLCVVPAQAVTLKSAGINLEFEHESVTQFLKEHTDLSLEKTEWNYFTTLELATQLTNRTLEGDFYLLPEEMVNHETLMSKGFCLDLTGSDILMDFLSRMHPHIAKQVMYDGRLYAWPTSITFSYMRIDPEAWEESGLTVMDIPDTFSGFLDFAERWCDRLEDDPDLGFHIMGGMNGYDEMFSERKQSLYTDWLLELLIRQLATQQQYAGEEALHFDDENIQALIRRCVTVGRRIYHVESHSSMKNKGLFVVIGTPAWPDTPEDVVYLRLNESQPKLMEAKLHAVAVNPATAYPDVCIEVLEHYAANPAGLEPYDQYFYVDAQPRVLPGWEEMIAENQKQIESLRLRLEDETLSRDDRAALEDELALREWDLRDSENNKWAVKPEALTDYKARADQLYFPIPTILTQTATSSQLFKLREQVSSGAISVDQFIQRLCEIATMIQQEQ